MKGRVLVVDDDAALSEMIGIMLRGEGFDPMFVADGDHAVQAFRDARPDLVLLDLMLPGLDGIDVCRQIRTESGVPIVMLTAKSDTVDVVLGLESGADDYIAKPFEPRELVLRTLGRMQKPGQFNELIIANTKGAPIRLKDVGRAEDSVEEPRGLSRLDGQNAVSLFVQRQSGTNTVQVVDAVKRRLDEIQSILPPDIQTYVIRDQSRFIKNSIDEVKLHLVLAGVLLSLGTLTAVRLRERRAQSGPDRAPGREPALASSELLLEEPTS